MRTPERLVSAYFSISGQSFDPGECTRVVGIQPSKIWRQKDRLLLQCSDLPKIGWSVGIYRQNLETIDEAIRIVLDMVWPTRKRILLFVRRNKLDPSFDCSVTIYSERPVYVLSAESMARMAWFGAEFGLDIFDYREDSNHSEPD